MRICLFYVVLLVIACTGCEKESKIKIPYDGDKIVVNSFIQPDSLIYIRVTKSKPVREYGNLQFPELSNAIVTIFENGVALPAPHWQVINGRGYFVSESVAGAGKHYSISATAQEFDDVNASDSTPMRPVITNLVVQRAINRIRFTLSDNAAQNNYYRIRFFYADSINGVLVKNKKDMFRSRLDPAFGDNFIDIINGDYYNEILISDERINGKDFEFVMQTEIQMQKDANLIIEVSGLSKGAYKFLLATQTQRQDDETDFTLDPVIIYSNVQNGYGIVAGVNASVFGFRVE